MSVCNSFIDVSSPAMMPAFPAFESGFLRAMWCKPDDGRHAVQSVFGAHAKPHQICAVSEDNAKSVNGVRDAIALRQVSQTKQIGESAGISQVMLLGAFGNEAHFVHVRWMHLDTGFFKKGLPPIAIRRSAPTPPGRQAQGRADALKVLIILSGWQGTESLPNLVSFAIEKDPHRRAFVQVDPKCMCSHTFFGKD